MVNLLCSAQQHYWSRGQPSSRIPPGVSRQAQRAIHQLKLNRLSSTASYQALIGQIETPTCPHCGNGDETTEHLLLLCPKWAAERQRYFGDSIDITDVFQDYKSLVEFLISSGHLSPHIGSAWRARHDNNNNKVRRPSSPNIKPAAVRSSTVQSLRILTWHFPQRTTTTSSVYQRPSVVHPSQSPVSCNTLSAQKRSSATSQ